MKCPEAGHIRCCGVSFNDIMRTTPKAPALIVSDLASDEVSGRQLESTRVQAEPSMEASTPMNRPTSAVSSAPVDESSSSSEMSVMAATSSEPSVAPSTPSTTKMAISLTPDDELSPTSSTTMKSLSQNDTDAFDDDKTSEIDAVDEMDTMLNRRDKSLSVPTTAEVEVSTTLAATTEAATTAKPTAATESTSASSTISTTKPDSDNAPHTSGEKVAAARSSRTDDELLEPAKEPAENESPSGRSQPVTNEMMMTTEAMPVASTELDTTMDDTTVTDADPTTEQSIELNVIDTNDEIKMRRPKLVDNVLMIYPHEMSGVRQTTPKNMPQRTNEVHVFDENDGMPLHVIFSTNQTATGRPIIGDKQNEIDDDDRGEVTTASAPATESTTAELETTTSAATTAKRSTTEATTTPSKPKRRRFSPYRVRPIKSITDETTMPSTTTIAATTARPARGRPLLLGPAARHSRSKSRNTTRIQHEDTVAAVTTVKPEELNVTPKVSNLEKSRNRLFVPANRFNLLPRKNSDNDTIAEASAFNQKMATKIDREHKLMMERVQLAIKSATRDVALRAIPRAYSGDALNNRIESLEKLVADRIDHKIKALSGGSDSDAQPPTTEATIANGTTTQKPFRGRHRYFSAAYNRSRHTTAAPVPIGPDGNSTSVEMQQQRHVINNYLRRRIQITTARPETVEPTHPSASSSTTGRIVRRRPANRSNHIWRDATHGRHAIHLRPRTTNTVAMEASEISTTPMPLTTAPTKISPIAPSKPSQYVPNKKETIFRRSPSAAPNDHIQPSHTMQPESSEPYVFHGNEQHFLLTPSGGVPAKFHSNSNQANTINGHQKPLTVGPIPRMSTLPIEADKLKFGLPADARRTKFYF